MVSPRRQGFLYPAPSLINLGLADLDDPTVTGPADVPHSESDDFRAAHPPAHPSTAAVSRHSGNLVRHDVAGSRAVGTAGHKIKQGSSRRGRAPRRRIADNVPDTTGLSHHQACSSTVSRLPEDS
ncbi:hypothetical protein WIMU106979_14705 [Williamsia muralis]